jgi:hypothetical protein
MGIQHPAPAINFFLICFHAFSKLSYSYFFAIPRENKISIQPVIGYAGTMIFIACGCVRIMFCSISAALSIAFCNFSCPEKDIIFVIKR